MISAWRPWSWEKPTIPLALFGLEGNLWSVRAGFFNGDTDAEDDNGRIDTGVAALKTAPLEGVVLGVSYLRDLAENDNGLVSDDTTYTDSVTGFGSFLPLQYGVFSLEGE